LSPAAAGRFLGVSKRQIYLLLAAGSIRARKLGALDAGRRGIAPRLLCDAARARRRACRYSPMRRDRQRLHAPILRGERRDHPKSARRRYVAAAAEAEGHARQVLDLLRRGYKRWQIATLCLHQPRSGHANLERPNGKPGVMPPTDLQRGLPSRDCGARSPEASRRLTIRADHACADASACHGLP